MFVGVDERGPVSVQIPRRYWKVVLANASGTLQAFAFVLEQDLSHVALEPEFAVDAEWAARMRSIDDLQAMLVGIDLGPTIRAADQFGHGGGDELLIANESLR